MDFVTLVLYSYILIAAYFRVRYYIEYLSFLSMSLYCRPSKSNFVFIPSYYTTTAVHRISEFFESV